MPEEPDNECITAGTPRLCPGKYGNKVGDPDYALSTKGIRLMRMIFNICDNICDHAITSFFIIGPIGTITAGHNYRGGESVEQYGTQDDKRDGAP